MNSCAIGTYRHPLARTRKGLFIAALRASVVFLALLVYAVLLMDLITNSQGLAAYTFLLLGYLYVELRNLRAREPRLFWINPVGLASMLTFVLAFVVTNVLYFMPEALVALVGLQPGATVWMNQLMLLVVLGACAMWVGYSSGVGRNIGNMLQRSRVLGRWMRKSNRVNRRTLYVFLAISLGARLLEIKLGVYAYSSTYARLIAGVGYTQYLHMAESLGKLALVGVALQCFSRKRPSLSDLYLLWAVLGYEVAFGFLSGFKSAVVMPFIIVGIVYYSQRNRFPRWLVPAVIIGIMAAYAVIEPFRAARNENEGVAGTNLPSIVATMTSGVRNSATDVGGSASLLLRVLARLNSTYYGSLGIEYAANNDLPEGSPQFLKDIILAPAHAIIPRFLWADKQFQHLGLWYTHVVLGRNYYSSSAMSPFTYLNFAGGPLAVILGFFVVGVLQRGLFDGLLNFGGGGFIVLFGLLGTLTNIDSGFNSFFIYVIRFFPILVVLQYFMLKRQHRTLP